MVAEADRTFSFRRGPCLNRESKPGRCELSTAPFVCASPTGWLFSLARAASIHRRRGFWAVLESRDLLFRAEEVESHA
jgi:hypothetical protein